MERMFFLLKVGKDVKDWIIKERGKIQDGVFVKDEHITVSSFLTGYLEEYCKRTLRATTFEGYKSVIEDHIIPELGNVKLVSLRADQINHLLSKKNLMQSFLTALWNIYTVF